MTEPDGDLGKRIAQIYDATAPLSLDELAGRSPRPSPARRAMIAGGVLVAVAAVLAVAWPPPGDAPNAGPVSSTPTSSAVLDVDGTGELATVPGPYPAGRWVAFDDGLEGAVLVSLESGAIHRVPLEGQRPGDQPHRLLRVGEALVVGWGEPYAVSLSDGASVGLGEATIALPAVEPGAMWLADWEGGSVGSGDLRLRRVDIHGNVRFESGVVDVGGFPAVGTSSGVAFAVDSGLALWDAEEQTVTVEVPGEQAFIADSADGVVAWCDRDCVELRLTDVEDGSTLRVAAPPGRRHGRAEARFSPDGATVAVMLHGVGDDSGGPVTLGLVDVASGELTEVPAATVRGGFGLPMWSRDGSLLALAGRPLEEDTGVATSIVVLDIAARRTVERRLLERALPTALRGGLFRGVILTDAEVATLRAAAPTAGP